MSQARVCIIRRAYYPMESHVRRNAESLVAAGYAVDVLCLRRAGEPAAETLDGVRVIRLPLQSRRSGLLRYGIEYAAFLLLASIVVSWRHIRSRYAVVEADSMPDVLVYAGLLPRLTGARLILYLFESMPELWAQRRGVPMSHWAVRALCWLEEASCALADAVICCHEMAREALVRRGVPEGKILVILNVPDGRLFHPRLEARARDGIFRLIQHGTITAPYGLQVVLRALAQMDPAVPVHLDIVGKGEYRPTLEGLTRRLGLQARVTFHGVVARERLLALLERADAGLVPMLCEYQSPNKLFEFVALGVPVIASDRRTFRQHFDGTEILYFKTGDAQDLARAIELAYRRPERTSGRARRAAARYERYHWQTMQERYRAVYARLLSH